MHARIVVVVAALALAGPAQAGQDCTPRRPSVAETQRELELAASVREQLDELAAQEGVRVLVLARAGQDLGTYGLRYSHLGFVYRDDTALGGRGAWRVVHKLNHCASDVSGLYRQGLAEFFSDGLHERVAGAVALRGAAGGPEAARRLADNAFVIRLHTPRYNMLAWPWGGPYQQSNQWAIETLAMLVDPGVASRADARDWLRRMRYQPTTLHLSATTRLGARLTMAHVSFDDHPLDRRLAGRIDTVSADSVLNWLPRAGLGGALHELRARTPPPPVAPPALPAGERT